VICYVQTWLIRLECTGKLVIGNVGQHNNSIPGAGPAQVDHKQYTRSAYTYEPAIAASPIASNYTRNEQWAPLAVYGKRARLRRKLRGQHKLTRKAPKTTRKATRWTRTS